MPEASKREMQEKKERSSFNAESIIRVSEDVKVLQIPVAALKPNDYNPNELDDRNFNRLAEDMQNIGFLQPLLVVPLDDGTYRIIDGEHRYEVAKLLDMEQLPCVVAEGDLAKDETKQKYQTMRMNMIRGAIDKRKFKNLVEDLVTNAPLEDVAEAMAYDDVDALRDLIADARKDLPKEMRKEFDKAREEIKTVEDLSKVLNRLFTKFGSTLPYNYMILDFGGKDHLWIRLPDKKAYRQVKTAAEICRECGVTFSSAVMSLLNTLTPQYIKSALHELEEIRDETNTKQQHSSAEALEEELSGERLEQI
jgi:hypothetical protein